MFKNKVAIYYPWDNFDTVPSLYNAAQLLAYEGYLVDIYTLSSRAYRLPNFNTDKISLKLLNHESRFDRWLEQTINAFPSGGLAGVFRKGCQAVLYINNMLDLVASLKRLKTEITSLGHPNSYLCFIAVDPKGLIQTEYLVKENEIPVIYYSLELLISDELNSRREHKLKEQEIRLSQKAKHVIIQDLERADILANDNQISRDKFILVPNAPIGNAKRERSHYWHKRFELPLDTKIVLYSGSLGSWTGTDKIVSSVSKWPDNWVLVVHTRFDSTQSAEVKRLQSLATPNKVFFSLNPVSNEQYIKILDGADIGIAFYIPDTSSTYTQKNIQSIGYSSGKIAYYLHSGLPVIVNDFSSIGEKLQREGCGIMVKDGSEIHMAICGIEQNYTEYSQNARRFFDQHLEYERNFKKVIEKIKTI
ncbi:hypothetical protein [Methanoculleus sp. 10]|uniref:hypothetical protein n=1 Tax=Methanoculleus sp. 10 TaxID=430615 RepID=UPI0025F57DDD|nr:hypothetical protein [Methanoculleus sp. 10]